MLTATPAMNRLEMAGADSCAEVVLPAEFTVAAWNLERCRFPEASAALLRPQQPQLLLLSEMDSGMARTEQRNTAAAVATELGMRYVFGVEFLELDLGGDTERPFCRDDYNLRGFHGNAILSAVPFGRVCMLRLDDHGHWFVPQTAAATDLAQPRLGGRMAILAEVETVEGPLCVVSTHLESNADADYRERQFACLLDEIDRFAPDTPVLIGGDLNTGNHLPPDFDWRAEGLFELARARGYAWDLTPDGVTTRASTITPHPTRCMKLDWFCSRQLGGAVGTLIAALDPQGVALSDHDCLLATINYGG